jgi:hypothetical protein
MRPSSGRQPTRSSGVHNKILDSGFRRNDERGRGVIPGKAAGRDPESRHPSETAVSKKLLCTLIHGQAGPTDLPGL